MHGSSIAYIVFLICHTETRSRHSHPPPGKACISGEQFGLYKPFSFCVSSHETWSSSTVPPTRVGNLSLVKPNLVSSLSSTVSWDPPWILNRCLILAGTMTFTTDHIILKKDGGYTICPPDIRTGSAPVILVTNEIAASKCVKRWRDGSAINNTPCFWQASFWSSAACSIYQNTRTIDLVVYFDLSNFDGS